MVLQFLSPFKFNKILTYIATFSPLLWYDFYLSVCNHQFRKSQQSDSHHCRLYGFLKILGHQFWTLFLNPLLKWCKIVCKSMYISIQKFSFPAYTPNLGRWARRGGGGWVILPPPSWCSVNNSKMAKAVTLELCSIL